MMVTDKVELERPSSTWSDAAAAPFILKEDWYGKLAPILHEGFPKVETDVVTLLSVATQCLARSLIVADKLVDQDDTNFAPGDLNHGATALQYKAQRALQRIFAFDNPFLGCYEDYSVCVTHAVQVIACGCFFFSNSFAPNSLSD